MAPKHAPSDDCFAQFDEAFAALSAELESPALPATPPPPPNYDDEFDRLDARLARAAGVETAEPITEGARPAAARFIAPAPLVPTSRAPRPIAARQPALWSEGAEGATPLERLLGTLDNLAILRAALDSPRASESLNRDTFARVFADARTACVEFDLETARVRAEFALEALAGEHLDRLAIEITELMRHIRHDAQFSRVWPVAQDHRWGFTFTLDQQASEAFPHAAREVEEGGRCFALGRYTAAVFHMIRAAEYGVRALARAADCEESLTDAESDWSGVLDQVEERIATIDKWRNGPEQAAAATLYQDAIRSARDLNNAVRALADVAHTFDEPGAMSICRTAKEFFARLTRCEGARDLREVPRDRKITVGLTGEVHDIAADRGKKRG